MLTAATQTPVMAARWSGVRSSVIVLIPASADDYADTDNHKNVERYRSDD
jgi:hypothetical protein